MKNTIFYFTGTGNSLKVAKDISANLQNSELLSMAANHQKVLSLAPHGAVGFVFPVYYTGLPRLVEEFISSINLTNVDYIYMVCTYGHPGGNSGCISQGKKILRRKGKELNAAFYVQHVNNFMLNVWEDCTLWTLEVTPEKKHKALHEKAHKKAKYIAEIVSRRKSHHDRSLTEYTGPVMFNYKGFYKRVQSGDKDFYTTDRCNSCGLCAKVCPTNNIRMSSEHPEWKSETCQRCLACLNLCPKASILHRQEKETAKKNRYKNPYITVKEIIESGQR